jgi:hypothetical protein
MLSCSIEVSSATGEEKRWWERGVGYSCVQEGASDSSAAEHLEDGDVLASNAEDLSRGNEDVLIGILRKSE